MPALPLALHLLSEVHGFLAEATLVSSSERHSVSTQASPLCKFLIHCIYNVSLEEYASELLSRWRPSLLHVRLHATIPIKGEVAVQLAKLRSLFFPLFFTGLV